MKIYKTMRIVLLYAWMLAWIGFAPIEANSPDAPDTMSNTQDRRQRSVRLLKKIAEVTHDSESIHLKRSNPHLNYYGGPIIANVELVSVLWGPSVNATIAQTMPNFFEALTHSTYMDWLCEYNTLGQPSPTTNQILGRGSYVGQTQITPSNTSTSLTDSDIQNELIHQLNAGNLPLPSYDAQGYSQTIYAIEFPAGITINSGGSVSCQAGGFCAYHGTLTYQNKVVQYSVHPDFGQGGGCDTGCGGGSALQNQESAHSSRVH